MAPGDGAPVDEPAVYRHISYDARTARSARAASESK
jgi:hypothetical protein